MTSPRIKSEIVEFIAWLDIFNKDLNSSKNSLSHPIDRYMNFIRLEDIKRKIDKLLLLINRIGEK